MLHKKDLAPLDAECSVCHQPIPKDRVHYGGVTCYSCRAFFRRNTQRDELPQCKADQSCSITYIDRKQCSACRYFKCISIGMKPELVLTEEDKKRRFKKFLKKKEEDDQQPSLSTGTARDDDDYAGLTEQEPDLPPLEPIQTKFCSFLTPSFRQNLHLLFNRQNTDLQPRYLEDRWNNSERLNNNRNKGEPPAPSPVFAHQPPQVTFLSSLQAPEEPSGPIDYSNSIKDMEALKYFANRGQLSTLVSPNIGQKYLVSPNKAELFLKPVTTRLESYGEVEEAADYSKKSLTERRSVITFPRVRVKSEHILCGHKRHSEDSEASCGYLHKKFRSQQESQEEEEEEEEEKEEEEGEEVGQHCLSSQQRQSVILHSSSANNISTT